ncbi:hypothetical protein OT109_00195 [Phycisphaeraceae bacterium D3-23]
MSASTETTVPVRATDAAAKVNTPTFAPMSHTTLSAASCCSAIRTRSWSNTPDPGLRYFSCESGETTIG